MTSNHLSFRRKLIGSFLTVALCVGFLGVNPQSRTAHASSSSLKTGLIHSPAPVEPRITFDPTELSVAAGNKVTVTAKVFDQSGNQVTEKSGDKWTWKIADPSLEEFLLVQEDAKEGDRASIVGLSGSSKSAAARPNLIPIIVTFSGEPKITGVLNVRLADAALTRGPIPPGIDPQVDIMWAVMPQKIVHDNFGSKIKKQYYGIEVVIGNDSGFDLELASVGFDLKGGMLESGELVSSKIPASGYRVTRASLQRRQQLNFRNMTLNIIRALGPILTGFTPFFHNVNHRNNYVEGVNILSNPIEKGFDLVVPDLTLGQLANLEDQSLRDNAITRTVVKNNTQVRFVVFVPKDLINDSKKHKEWRDKPLEVMKRLGRMILVGDQVEHINRVRVVSSPETGVEFSISGQVFDACNRGVADVTMTLNQGGGVTSTTKTDKDGKYIFDNVPSGLSYTVTPSKTGVTFKPFHGTNSFTLHGNRTFINFFTEQPPFTVRGKITKPDGDDADTEDDPVEGVDVELTSRSGAGAFQKRTKKTLEDGSYVFEDVPGEAVYQVTPKPSEGKTYDYEFHEIPSPNCVEKTYDFKRKP